MSGFSIYTKPHILGIFLNVYCDPIFVQVDGRLPAQKWSTICPTGKVLLVDHAYKNDISRIESNRQIEEFEYYEL